ncbi:MAG: S41 family peptidase [Armatimonadota bacterium]|nr:S41 family peptidase [Armatimonadota bacterium]MDR7421843.1 S41 family peptidase [Armatimonadota bacterium]MDR7457737.1 S41 family peptidase [Armatimonadota bacterium]MDR7512484.1 S41 family peptidase [Armatimonadota bacterium]
MTDRLASPIRRIAPAVLLVLAVTLLGPGPAPRVQAADVGLVLEAYGVLRDRYVGPIDPVSTLNGAIAGLRAALSAAGVVADLVEIPMGTAPAAAEAAFRTRFAAAVAAAGGRVQTTALAYAAIRGMTATLNDSHTGFITPEQNRERQLRQRRQAAFSGVGIVLMPLDGRFYVRDVIPGTPAEAAGVQALDRIVRVDATPTTGLQTDQVAGLIRGPAGTSVSLVLDRPGRAAAVVLAVTRAPIQIPAVFQARVMEGGIGYLQLYQFVNRTGADVREALQRMLGAGMRALVLDLRGNSGGFLHELNATVNLFLLAGRPVYQETTRGGQSRTVRTTGVPVLPTAMPVVVLIDEGSASAAELLAAALQEQGRATLIGAKTSGAVEASVVIDLSDDSALSVTILRLASGQGRRLEGVGVTPDVAVANSAAELDQGRDTQLVRAIQLARQRLGLSAAPRPAAGR